MQKQVTSLQKEINKKYDITTGLIGESKTMKMVASLIDKALTTNISVMITGETGTGKEVVAKAIHYNSSNSKNPFVAINVASIPADLIESELFGHEKGAFTGAINTRIGKFEEANGGTLFLDEIGEMDINLQTKLLRVIQEKEIVRVGSNLSIKINCRIITATHKILKDEIKKGNFREDLYYRLYGLPIELPPLRERDNDIIILANYFVLNFCKENGMQIKIISDEAQKKLLNYSFKGNVRELKAIIELSVVMSNGPIIEAADIKVTADDISSDLLSKEITLQEYNMQIIHSYMGKYNNNVKIVAEKLNIGQSTIYKMLKK